METRPSSPANLRTVEQVMVAKVEVVLVLVGEKEKRGEHHPSWRRTAASPHRTAPDASRNQEVAREEGGEGGPAEHWRLPQFGGGLPALQLNLVEDLHQLHQLVPHFDCRYLNPMV